MNISEEVIERLRDCQKESIKTVSTYLSSRSKKSCLISLPTGAGKSGVICIASHSSKSKRVLILTHRRPVCDQLAKQLKGDFYKKILGDEADISNLKPLFKDIDNFEKEGIYCTTVQMITKLSESELDSIKDKVDLVIFDEGHAEPASKWSKAVRKFECKKLIITATPYRNDLFSFDIDVKHHYIYTFKKAVEKHDIVEPNFEVVNEDRLIERIREIKGSQPESVCIVKCKKFSDVQQYFEWLKTEFNTVAIHDSYAKSDDENTLQSVPANIHEKDYEVIIHQRKLDEGVDLPQAKILILTYPVGSGRELVQTVGRVVRTYKQYQPYVIGLDNNNNLDLWSNFKEFDEYLSNEKTAKKFIKTLDTAVLIESYIDEFPEHSYYNSGFKKKFDFKGFDPVESLEIPLASVCFYKKNPEFDLADCLDKLYWEFNRQGALSKYDAEFGVVTSIVFSNSRFLKDSLFFEPSLEIMVVKELGQEYIAIFDSQGRKFSDNKDLGIGRAVDMDTLFKVISEANNTTHTKQANTRALQKSDHRPEGISYIGNLEAINHPATNSNYAIRTGVFNSINTVKNTIDNSFYLGVGSGRVSDQKKRRFSYHEFMAWLDDISNKFKTDNTLQSNFVRSFAKSADSAPEEEPSACMLDFTIFEDLSFYYNNIEHPLANDYIYKIYDQGFCLLDICDLSFVRKYSPKFLPSSTFTLCVDKSHTERTKVRLSFDDENKLCIDTSDKLKFYINNKSLEPEQAFNKDTIKLLYNNGITFLGGEFFELQMPTDSGVLNRNLISKIISLDCLLEVGLSEKDERNTAPSNFGADSIFYQIDKLSNIKNNNPSLESLGDFYRYLPNVDLILCTDMGTEPADFILSSEDRLIMVHVKCGKASQSPKSSAGAIYEVGSQAVKNLHTLVSQKFERYANDTNLRNNWKVSSNKSNQVELDSRIRLYNGKYDLNLFQQPDTLNKVFEEINKRRKDVLVKKEVWLVIGNAFSNSHFTKQMKNISNAEDESKQAYQLVETWLSTLSSHDVDLKMFVSH
ncbi:DEAD/DEAH box helicase [Psychrobacter sp. LV10R520-6]|uniref:DEAD/DEAH box helicase n=1 Tax=Psychrobacter sp. LV10R520-6 TaxID=1415574 RepID=UPI0024C88313|nr:DEAD/DEAH box helicase family protein [Psychrobacter sp. LV10R520-6]SNT71328.1 Superfamily II DNA or RNA helicase [Psychrobacter sp. LV10R520-6]